MNQPLTTLQMNWPGVGVGQGSREEWAGLGSPTLSGISGPLLLLQAFPVFPQSPVEVRCSGLLPSPFADEETEVQREQVTCFKPHSKWGLVTPVVW